LALALKPILPRTDLLLQKQWSEFKIKYNRNYATPDEEAKRFSIFKQSLQTAAKLQEQNPLARFGATKFSDLAPEELPKCKIPNLKEKLESKFRNMPVKDFSIPSKPNARGCSPNPTTYDWNTCGVITPVFNDGQCGACWASTVVETVESYYALGGGHLTQLSVQQILDCDTTGEDQGCDGGFPDDAYKYIESAGGLESAADYPYISGEGESQSCKFNKQDVVTTVTSFSAITTETDLYKQLSSVSGGPVSVCVDTTVWYNYQGGVLTSCTSNIDCCEQLTGYHGYGSNGSYWIVRNSWGANWGENGYIWIATGSNLCGIGDLASIATVSN